MSETTFQRYLRAQQSLAMGETDLLALVRGTKWEGDPRIAAFLAADADLSDLLWDVHSDAEQTEGLCPDCLEAEREVLGKAKAGAT